MAGPPIRERYNAKARGAVAGGSAHKKRKRVKSDAPSAEHAGESSQSALAGAGDEVAADPTNGMSSKKRKRFESFMAKKIKNDQRLETLKLLASLAPSAPTSASLLSSATLGQNPLNPSSAQERVEKKEDKLVRQGIEKLSKKYGDVGSASGSGSEGDSEVGTRKGKGKGRAVEVVTEIDGYEQPVEVKKTVLPSKSEEKAKAKAAGKGKGKGRTSKKADWNPNLLPTQPQSSSSEFDSSDSNYDSASEAGPSSKRAASPATEAPNSIDRNAVDEIEKPPPPPPVPAASLSFGGALKRSGDGIAVQPRVEIRGPKRILGWKDRRRGVGIEEAGTSADDEEEDDSEEDADGDEDDEEGDEDDDVLTGDDEEDDSDDDEDDSDEAESGSNDENDEDGEEESESVSKPIVKKRALGFKNWALKQMGNVTQTDAPNLLESTPVSTSPVTASRAPANPAPKTGEFVGPLGEAIQLPTTSLLDQSKNSKGSTIRPVVKRRESVSEARINLPVVAEEQSIMESILLHPVVVICGETGSGKTTQVPQMLYEAGFGYKGSDNPGMIAVTQPRRVAAVSLAERVRSELNLPKSSSVVAHQIRYSSTTSQNTSIKFMTDGVLLRELATDFLLSRYSVVVVDEAHERGVNTDVLVGVLSRVAKLREKMWRDGSKQQGKDEAVRPLRIVIMSATLRVSDFAENPTLFAKPPPVIQISARQHPVTIHFSRKTTGDYVTEAYKKVAKIHARLPAGGILVFLTGQNEIQALCRKLDKKYGKKKGQEKQIQNSISQAEATANIEDREAEDVELGGDNDLAADVDDGVAEEDPEALDTEDEMDDETMAKLGLEIDEPTSAPMHILPLYSLLSNEQQMAVFKPPPEGHRLVIVSTNVAETSLTIPGIRYVVDSGRAKERHYEAASGVQTFQVSWISKASASQRSGRAGRTGPGHCYRLYSSALYEDHFEQFSKPEILRMPIEGVVLQMKSMNIDSVINFPFPTPPDRGSLRKAETLLTHLGALELPTITKMVGGVQQTGSAGGRITDLGKAMAGYPVSPRFAKMLVIAQQNGCLPYIIAIVAGLSVGDPFLHEQAIGDDGDEDDDDEDEEEGEEGRKRARRAELAHIRSEEIRQKEERKDTRRKFFKAHQAFAALGRGSSDMFKLLAAIGAYEYDPSITFCEKNFLRAKAMHEIHQLRAQISAIAKVPLDKLLPPNDTQLKILRQILTAGFIDQIAVREDIALKKGSSTGTSYSSTRGVPYRVAGLGSEAVYIHPSSVLFHRSPPDYIVFAELVRTSRIFVKGITKINSAWIVSLGKGLCSFSKPLEQPGARGSKGVPGITVGKGGVEEREVFVTPHFRDLGVDLPVIKMKQRKEGTRWVLVE